jgi:hypothetical protein
MEASLFDTPPRYTIDSSSLMDIFGPATTMISKQVTPGLWERLEQLILTGLVISHVEVLYEIKKDGLRGEELYEWANSHSTIFKEYSWESEGAVIKSMSPRYSAFVNQKVGDIYADPWLVAQAKTRGLSVITEEKAKLTDDPQKHKLPNVCRHYDVKAMNLLEFTKEQGWTFR